MVDGGLSRTVIHVLTTKWKVIQLILITSSVLLLATALYFYEASGNIDLANPQSEKVSKNEKSVKLQRKENPSDSLSEKIQRKVVITSEPWKSRLDTLKRGCTSKPNGYELTTSQVTQRYYSSSRAGFAVCKVPKAGSTFWTILFLILQQERKPEQVFLLPRYTLHNIGNNIGSRRPANDSNLNIVVSRDPYARLFSAYIDKVFLLGWQSSRNRKHKKDPKLKYVVNNFVCGYNTTFPNFLDRITKKALTDLTRINRHWAPVHLLCDTCNISYQAVLRTETLTSDAEFIVDQLQVSKSKKMSLKNILHRKEGNKTLVGLLEDVLRPLLSPRKACPDRLAYLYKLWQSLQIQGYLHNQSIFPWNFFKKKENFEDQAVINLILDTMAKRPLSSEDRKLQRRAALVSAYKNVGKELIKRIQKMFVMDFRLFGYDVNPPS